MPANPYTVILNSVSSASGYSTYVVDWRSRFFPLSIGCVVNSTGISYNVEHTFDYTGSSAFNSTAATWFVSSGISAATTNAYTSYTFPVTAIRGNILSTSSTAATSTMTMTILQSG